MESFFSSAAYRRPEDVPNPFGDFNRSQQHYQQQQQQQQQQQHHHHQQQQQQPQDQQLLGHAGSIAAAPGAIGGSTLAEERSWPQSEFVKNVIEAPIDLANPGWREKEIPNGRSIRLRAEAGMRDIDGTRSASAIGGRDNIAVATSFPSSSSSSAAAAAAVSREGRKIIPSHLTHMKYKGIDPIDPENKAQTMNNLQREDPTLYSGTGSFGTRTRRKSDALSVPEDDQKRRDLEHELANFPPVLPTAMFASFSEDEIDLRRTALEDEVRLRFNIPPRSSSPSSLRKASHAKSNTLSRRLPATSNEADHPSARPYSTAVNLGADAQSAATTLPDPVQARASPVHPSESSFAAVKAFHPLIVSNHNTWRRILEHMLNHGVIVNPFNNITQFRLRSCFPLDTPTDILASADTRRPQYPPNQELLAMANEVVMGTDWIKLTYENSNQALNALKSDGVLFDGFPLKVKPWDESDSFTAKASSADTAPLWLLPAGSGASSRDPTSTQALKRKPTETFSAATTGKGRQLVLVNDDNIFLKQPGLFEQLKAHLYDWLFQNTARYDEEGNYIRGTGGWMLDIWHIFVG